MPTVLPLDSFLMAYLGGVERWVSGEMFFFNNVCLAHRDLSVCVCEFCGFLSQCACVKKCVKKIVYRQKKMCIGVSWMHTKEQVWWVGGGWDHAKPSWGPKLVQVFTAPCPRKLSCTLCILCPPGTMNCCPTFVPADLSPDYFLWDHMSSGQTLSSGFWFQTKVIP